MRFSQVLTAAFLPAALLVGCGQGQPETEVSATDLQQLEEALITTSTPQLLATLESGGTMRMGSTHLYFLDYDQGAIRRVSKAGGEVQTVLVAESDEYFDPAFAHDDQYVYAILMKRAGDYFGNVVRVPVTGGEPQGLLGGGILFPAIAVDATHVYLSTMDPERLGSGPASKLVRFPKDGGIFLEPEVIANGQNNVTSIAADASSVYWIDSGTPNPANGCNPYDGKVRSWNKFTKVTRVLAIGENCPLNLVLDGTTLYWGNLSRELRKLSIWSYFAFPLTIARDVDYQSIATDASYVYGTTSADQKQQIMALGKIFGTRNNFPTTLGSTEIEDLAADTQNLYYLRHDGETGNAGLYKLRK